DPRAHEPGTRYAHDRHTGHPIRSSFAGFSLTQCLRRTRRADSGAKLLRVRARSRRPYLLADLSILAVVSALVLALGLLGGGGGGAAARPRPARRAGRGGRHRAGHRARP